MSRYSRGQLVAAKTGLLALAAAIVGSYAADSAGEVVSSILVVFIGLGALAAAYELLARALALLLGRIGGRSRISDPPSAAEPTSVASFPELPGRMRLGQIAAAFGGYLAGQALVWLGVATVVIARLGAGADEEAITRGMQPLLPAVLPVSVLAGGLGAIWALRSWGKRMDRSNLGEIIALRPGTRRQLLRGMLGGAGLGLVALVLMPYVPYAPSSPDVMDEFLRSPGPARWSWIITAVILAPPVEELVFRGVLLGGLAQVWGLRAAAIVSGLAFWAMHAPEWLRYWPAAVAIALMTVVVTLLRIQSRALGPAIAAHAAYNLLMASVALGSPSDTPLPGNDRPKWAQAAPSHAFRAGTAASRVRAVLPSDTPRGRDPDER